MARGVDPGAFYAFVTDEFDGKVSVVDAKCVAASQALGEPVQYCVRGGARVGLYAVDAAAGTTAEYRANARPNYVGHG